MPEKREDMESESPILATNTESGDAIVKEVVDKIVSCSIADAEIISAQQTHIEDPSGAVSSEQGQGEGPAKVPESNTPENGLESSEISQVSSKELEESVEKSPAVSGDPIPEVVSDATVEAVDNAGPSGDTPSVPAPPTAASPVPAPESQKSGPTVAESTPAEQIYHIKWIEYGKAKTPIVTQNSNGPCPLVGIMNVLLIRGQVQLPDEAAVVTGQQLMHRLGDCILRLTPEGLAESLQADYEANVSDAVAMLPKLMTGLDVNVRFTGISDFEYTRECIVFDLLGIPLYHGWLVDPEQEKETGLALGNKSYNQLVEFIINSRSDEKTDETTLTQAVVAEQFLENTASQLTYHGLCELNRNLKDGELAVFFRNNHFATMLKNRDELFLLVTDQGFLEEGGVVWETLNSVDGDSHFVDAFFHSIPPKPDLPLAAPPADSQNQIDKDYLMALSLEAEDKRAAPEPTAPVSTDTTPSSFPATQPPQPDARTTSPPVATEVEGDAALARQLQAMENQRAAAEAEEIMNREEAASASGGGEAGATGATTPTSQPPPMKQKEDKCRIL